MSMKDNDTQVQLPLRGRLKDEDGLCLLSIDGGGVRGLSSLYILRRIIIKMNAERQQRGEPEAKPCDVFDLIGGTSTGGLIAILLGRLEMSVDECIAIYKEWMREVFRYREHLFKVNSKAQIQHRFSPSLLKKAIERTLASKNIPADELYDNGEQRSCRTGYTSFVVARRVESRNHVLIRDFTMPGEVNDDKLTIVDAALATSAASTIFPPHEAIGKSFVDGALGDNNPTPLVYQTAQDIWAEDDGRLDERLRCNISLGTGRSRFSAIEASAWGFLSKTLKKIVVETEETERQFAKTNRHLLHRPEDQRYFRFNVDAGLDGIGLQEHEKANLIEVATSEYLENSQARTFEIRRCARQLSQKSNRKQIKLPSVHKFSNVPRKHRYFVGRDGVLDTLRQRLHAPQGVAQSEPNSCLIYGIGGIGKTQLARAYSDQATYDFHFWVQAESVAKLTDSFQAIAHAIGLPLPQSDPNVVESVKSILEQQDSSWLLIFDNVDDGSFNEVVEAMPNKAKKASGIIVTSQFDELKHYTQSVICLAALTEQEGVDLLSKCLQKDPATVPHHEQGLLRDISSKLGGLPLALAHTGGYMSKSKDLSQFTDFFKDRWERIIYPTKQRIVHQYEYKALAVVWDFALGKLEPDSRKLINILAYLDADDIEQQWLVEERSLSRGWVENGLNATTHVYNLMSSLNDRCLVETKQTKSSDGVRTSYSIHRSLQIALRLKLDQNNDNSERTQVLGHAISIMRRVTPRANNLQTPDRTQWPAFANASPHVFSMCLAFQKAHPAILGTEDLARLFYDTGFHYWERWSAVPRDGITLLLAAEEILDKLGYDEPRLRSDISCMVSSLLDLAGAGYMDVVKSEARTEALRRRKEVVKMRGRVMLAESLSQDYVKLANGKVRVNEILYYNGVNDLALSYLQVNEFQQAELLFERCYAKYVTWGTVDEIPFEYGKYFHNTAFVRMYQGRYDEAVMWAEKALVCKEKADNTRVTPRYLWIQYNKANILVQAGRLAEALELHLEILRDREMICGSKSEHVLQSLYAIGATCYHLGRLDDAENHFRECLDRARKSRWTTAHALERAQWHLAATLKQQKKDQPFVEQLEDAARTSLQEIVKIVANDPPAYLEHMLADVETHGISLFDWALPCFGNRWTGRGLLGAIQESHGHFSQ